MEFIGDRELGIVGERYGSFAEAYRVNDRRPLNALVAKRGDGASQGLVEADDGIVFSPAQTRQALLYGSELFSGRYKEMRKRVRGTLAERYEWMDEDRFGADVRGDNVIMERYAIGHPESFHRRRRALRRKRSVAILYDAMCPASTPVARRIEAGCIVVACADALERMGYEVALDFCLATYDGNSMSEAPTLLLEVALKGYGDALNAKRLEFPLAAKPVLFHLGVWWAHRFPQLPADFGQGEGYPVSYDANRVRALEEHARRRHGAYLSEDIVEMQLGMDPTRALERILGAVGEADALEEHMAGKTTMQAASSPAQGKLFGGTRAPGEDLRARLAQGAGDAGAGSGADKGAPGKGAELPSERGEGQAPGKGDSGGRGTGADPGDEGPARGEDGDDPRGSRETSRPNGGTGAMAADKGDGDAAGADEAASSRDGEGPDGPTGASDADDGPATADGREGEGREETMPRDGSAGARNAPAGSTRAPGAGVPGASERDASGESGPSGDDGADGGAGPGEDAGPGRADARRASGEGRQDLDDVEPGSEGMIGFGGLTGAPDAVSAGSAAGAAGAGSAHDGKAPQPAPQPGGLPRPAGSGDSAPAGGADESARRGDGASRQGPEDAGGPGGGTDSDGGREGPSSPAGRPGGRKGADSATAGPGATAPSNSGAGGGQGGGGAGSGSEGDRSDGDEESPERDGGEERDDATGKGEQGESMNDNPYDRHDPEGPGEMDPAEGQQADGSGHDAIPDADDPAQGDEPRQKVGDQDLDEPVRDSFVVELRKRYVRFERGDYRRKMEREAREAQVAASAAGPVKAPPARAVTGADDYEFGTPRSTPFSMNYVPRRKE